MNKGDLVAAVAGDAGISKSQAQAAVDSVLSNIEGSLASGGRVTLVGFEPFDRLQNTNWPRGGPSSASVASSQFGCSGSPLYLVDGGLQSFARREPGDLPGRNPNGHTCSGIPTHSFTAL